MTKAKRHTAAEDDAEIQRIASLPAIKAVHRVTGEKMTFTREWFDAQMAGPRPVIKAMFTQDEDEYFSLVDAITLMRGVHHVHGPILAWAAFQCVFFPSSDDNMRIMEYKLEGGK